MMDRHISRGKRLDSKDWTYGFYLELQGKRMGEKITRACILDRVGRTLDIDPATLGQCTRLRDKNGTLIFEGDIIQFTNRRAWYCGFSFDENDYIKYPFYREAVILPQSYERLLMQEIKEYWEVIGNRWDGPALLGPTP